MLVVIGTDCIGSHKSNYHTITTMTAPTPDGFTGKSGILIYLFTKLFKTLFNMAYIKILINQSIISMK